METIPTHKAKAWILIVYTRDTHVWKKVQTDIKTQCFSMSGFLFVTFEKPQNNDYDDLI